jgi:hypothetical protein
MPFERHLFSALLINVVSMGLPPKEFFNPFVDRGSQDEICGVDPE